MRAQLVVGFYCGFKEKKLRKTANKKYDSDIARFSLNVDMVFVLKLRLFRLRLKLRLRISSGVLFGNMNSNTLVLKIIKKMIIYDFVQSS